MFGARHPIAAVDDVNRVPKWKILKSKGFYDFQDCTRPSAILVVAGSVRQDQKDVVRNSCEDRESFPATVDPRRVC